MHCISKAAKRQSNNPTVPKLSGRGHPNSQESHVRRVKKGGRPLQLAAVYCMPHPFPADNINLSNSMIFIPNCSTRKIVFVSFKIKQRHRTSLGIKDIEICQPSNLPAANSPSWAGAKSHIHANWCLNIGDIADNPDRIFKYLATRPSTCGKISANAKWKFQEICLIMQRSKRGRAWWCLRDTNESIWSDGGDVGGAMQQRKDKITTAPDRLPL